VRVYSRTRQKIGRSYLTSARGLSPLQEKKELIELGASLWKGEDAHEDPSVRPCLRKKVNSSPKRRKRREESAVFPALVVSNQTARKKRNGEVAYAV